MQVTRMTFYSVIGLILAVASPANAADSAKHFQADLAVLVDNQDKAVSTALQKAAALGGYFTHLTSNHVSVKVPSSRFSNYLKAVEALGELADQRIVSSDMLNSKIRLEAVIKSRQKSLNQYMAILGQTANRSELVEAERATNQVINELEKATGRHRLVEHQIEFAVVNVRFNLQGRATVGQGAATPFAWINRVGVNQVMSQFKLGGPSKRSSGADGYEEVIAH